MIPNFVDTDAIVPLDRTTAYRRAARHRRRDGRDVRRQRRPLPVARARAGGGRRADRTASRRRVRGQRRRFGPPRPRAPRRPACPTCGSPTTSPRTASPRCWPRATSTSCRSSGAWPARACRPRRTRSSPPAGRSLASVDPGTEVARRGRAGRLRRGRAAGRSGRRSSPPSRGLVDDPDGRAGHGRRRGGRSWSDGRRRRPSPPRYEALFDELAADRDPTREPRPAGSLDASWVRHLRPRRSLGPPRREAVRKVRAAAGPGVPDRRRPSSPSSAWR